MKKKIPTLVSPSVKIADQAKDTTTIRVVGAPYGGPEFLQGKDLDGEYFSKNTDFGRRKDGSLMVPTVYSYYDHAINPAIGREMLGTAKFVEETDEGLIWDIEIDRAHRYHDMLALMAERSLLGASTQPVQTAVDIDWSTGEIKSWQIVEVSLTPRPANPKATIVEILKNSDLELPNELLEIGDAEKSVENNQDLADRIDNIFVDEPETNDRMMEILSSMQDTFIAAVDKRIAELRSEYQESAKTNTESIRLINDRITNIDSGLYSFAKNIAKQLRVQVRDVIEDDNKKSELEREVENRHKNHKNPNLPGRSPIPPGAPGAN